MAGKREILIFAPSETGGLADYTHHQARALSEQGIAVEVLAGPRFRAGQATPYPLRRSLLKAGSDSPQRWRRAAAMVAANVLNPWILAWHVALRRPRVVFFESYVEYFSPLWVWPHALFGRVLGMAYGANLHDPRRDYVLGPGWWHRLSVRLAYLPFTFGLLHQEPPGDAGVPARLRLHVVPHGPYPPPPATLGAGELRARLGLPAGGRVLLSFGFIRDNKNLDLVIRALADFPGACLLVAGRTQASKDKPVAFYRDLADKCGVGARVFFQEGFIPDAEIAAYFELADAIVLTYDRGFVSQSGVINIGALFGRPVIASDGGGPLREVVERFHLGPYVEPDSLEALKGGLARLLDPEDPPRPDWEGYLAWASWETNVRPLAERVHGGEAIA